MPELTLLLPSDPRANYLAHRGEIDQAIGRVLEKGRYILGEEAVAFEQEFARYMGLREAVGVGNGTDALHVALRACGVGPGDAVLTVSHTAVATVAATELAGATPVLVDIDPATYTLSPQHLADTLAAMVSRRTASAPRPKAVIPVHLYGHPADLPAILDIARRYELYVVEDCAQSHGATLQGRKTGTWGNLAAFSFYPTKNLGALGDGGAVATDDPRLGERVRLLREYGWRERYISELAGLNTRLDELQAAILRVKLRYLDRENARRRELARIYDAALSGTRLVTPVQATGAEHVYHQYIVRTGRRDDLRAFLKDHAVGTLIHYPVPVHLQPAYRGRIALGDGGLPYTERAATEIVSLPMYPELTDAQVEHVGELMARWDGQK